MKKNRKRFILLTGGRQTGYFWVDDGSRHSHIAPIPRTRNSPPFPVPFFFVFARHEAGRRGSRHLSPEGADRNTNSGKHSNRHHESGLGALSLTSSRYGGFDLRKPWKRFKHSHHALLFGLSPTAKYFRRWAFSAHRDQNTLPKPIPILFSLSGSFFVPERLPVPACLLSFSRQRNAGK